MLVDKHDSSNNIVKEANKPRNDALPQVHTSSGKVQSVGRICQERRPEGASELELQIEYHPYFIAEI
jgi:hypothetical protein